MVGKLIKYELKALFRILLFVGIGAVAVAAVGRIILAADQENIAGQLFGSLAIMTAMVGLGMAFIASVAQFSASFFTGEGYMTFSIPATPMQIVVAKLIAALVATLYGIACAAVCFLIYASGLGEDIFRECGEFVSGIAGIFGEYIASDPLIAVELVLMFIGSLPMGLLFFYLICCVGQLFTRWRKGMTFAIGIGSILLVSVLSTYALTPVLTIMEETLSVHAAAWTQIVIDYALDVGMFFLIRYLLLHKVNLIV